jgi:hypothetical protein
MPEHTNDPIQDLENFGTGGLAVTPLDPAQVRRLGDRRRNRRRGALAMAAAVVAIAGTITPIALLSGHDSSKPPITHTPSPSPSGPIQPSPTEPAQPSPSEPTVTAPSGEDITYPGNGIEIQTVSDTEKLTGTTAEFRDFIAHQLQKAAAAGASCPGAAHSVTVQKYSPAGYAIGGVNSCGGYAALWVLGTPDEDPADAQWQEGMGTQDAWDCDTLSYLGVPTSFAGQCFDESGDFGPTGTGGVDLGMTAAEVEAAGGTVQSGGDGACSTMVLPYFDARPNSTDGYLDPDHKVVMLAGRPGVKTPEKVGLGSSKAKVKAAYPTGQLSGGYWVVPLGHGTEYEFGLNGGDAVTEMLLADARQPCTQ